MDSGGFVRIVLRPSIGFDDVPDPALLDELHQRAHEACFVANSLKCPVEVEGR
jgi:organic hydroperoxide reductase OsmC/OhrA